MGAIVKGLVTIGAVVVGSILGGPIGAIIASVVVSTAMTVIFPTKAPKADLEQTRGRLQANFELNTPRKMVLGRTAYATDIRYECWDNPDDPTYLYRIVACAGHKVIDFEEIWFDNELVWTSAGGVIAKYLNYLSIEVRTEGNATNAININSAWGTSAQTYLTGCAYVYFRYRVKPLNTNSKDQSPFSSQVSNRVTIIGKGGFRYDPRYDSTVPGGAGTQRANDQTTWVYIDPTKQQNLPIAILNYLIGWRINGKLSVGCGYTVANIDIPSFIAAANLAEEVVTRAAGGSESRYAGACVVSDADSRQTALAVMLAGCNGYLTDASGKIQLKVLYNDLASASVVFTDGDFLDNYSWSPFKSAEETPNTVRGKYIDSSTIGLYQLRDYVPIAIASLDGVERTENNDLTCVESPSQCQRLASQHLQRLQYPGVFKAAMDVTGFNATIGQPVKVTFGPLGFVEKLFRVVGHQFQDGQLFLTFAEENAAIYAWDNGDTAPIVAAAPQVFDPLKAPMLQRVADAWGADWTLGVTGVGKPENNATSNRDSIYDPFNYLTTAEFVTAWGGPDSIIGGAADLSIVTSSDTPGGTYIQVGNNVGNDGQTGVFQRQVPFDPEDLYEVIFDVEFGPSLNGGAALLGVRAENSAGANVPSDAGVFCYVAAMNFAQNNAGRKTFRGYFRGRAAVGVGNSVGFTAPDRAVPGTMPNGTVAVRPVFLVNYSGAAGIVYFHQMWCRKISDATLIPTGAWSSSRSYFRDEGVTYLGRSFGSKIDGNLNFPPPATATSDVNWYLVADKGADGAPGATGATGAAGADGLTIAELQVFQRAAAQPATPSGGVYDFGTKTLTTVPAGWSVAPPAGADPLWSAKGTASVQGTTGTATPTWAGVGKIAQDGADGNGVDVVFQRAATQPATPAASVGAPAGWYTDVASVPASTDPLWSSFGQRPNAGSNYTWDTPARIEGAQGIPGNNNAPLLIYRRSPTSPALPSLTTTYTFSTKSLANLDNGWTTTVPADNGQPCWVSGAAASSPTDTDTIGAAEWAAPVIGFQSGTNGSAGVNNATVTLYKRSATLPAGPTTTTTYDFNTGAATGQDNGWAKAFPANNGQPAWAITATALSTGTTDTIPATEWPAAVEVVKDGAPGISPVTVRANPSSMVLKLDAAGAVKIGQLPLIFGISATKGGAGIAVTSITITSSSGGTWDVLGSAVRLTAMTGGAASGECTFTVVAGGETLTGNTVGFSTSQDGSTVNQVNKVWTPTNTELAGASFAQSGTNVAFNARAAGTLSVNLTGSIRPSGAVTADQYAYISKLQYSLDNGATWTDVTGSQANSTVSQDSSGGEPGVPQKWTAANINGTGPYALTGLGANAAVLFRAMTMIQAPYSGFPAALTGNFTIFADAN